jgi:hypothetical protein
MLVDCMLYVLEMLEGMRCVLLRLLEAVEGVCYVLGLPEVVFFVLEGGRRWSC